MTKASLITGITGQGGSCLAELLSGKGYEVYGLVRRLSTPSMSRISHIVDDIIMRQNYVEVMWQMLPQDAPGDYVVATGSSHSVKEFVELAFSAAGLDWRDHVKTEERFIRPAEVPELRGDASKAKERLGWAAKTSIEELVEMMVRADVERMAG
jgi:GDP-D-mannose dehydratase